MNDDNPYLEDAELVEETPQEEKAPMGPNDTVSDAQVANAAMDVIRVEEQIKDRMDRIEKIREETLPHKEMIDSILDGEPKFRELSEVAKKANQAKSQLKKQILDRPNAKIAVEKLKTLREEMKETQEALSYYLREFQRMTGANEFEGNDGELRQIVYVAKLVKKTSKR